MTIDLSPMAKETLVEVRGPSPSLCKEPLGEQGILSSKAASCPPLRGLLAKNPWGHWEPAGISKGPVESWGEGNPPCSLLAQPPGGCQLPLCGAPGSVLRSNKQQWEVGTSCKGKPSLRQDVPVVGGGVRRTVRAKEMVREAERIGVGVRRPGLDPVLPLTCWQYDCWQVHSLSESPLPHNDIIIINNSNNNSDNSDDGGGGGGDSGFNLGLRYRINRLGM